MDSDCQAAIKAITKPSNWPRYRSLLVQIQVLKAQFGSCSFEMEYVGSNVIVREIAKSVNRDGRFQSYLALGVPTWLHDRLVREAS